MKNIILMLALATAFGLAGCSSDKTYLNDQSGRITELERRADLNDQINQSQSMLIQLNADAISSLQSQLFNLEVSVIEMGASLTQAIADESAARVAGDALNAQNLQNAVSQQASINSQVNTRLNQLNSKIQAEKAERIASDLALAALLLQERNARIAGDQAQANALASQIAAQQQINSQLNASISQLDARITQERNARIASDAALALAQLAESAARLAGDQQNQALITQEKNARIAADNALQAAINNEKNQRIAADLAEAQARIAGDASSAAALAAAVAAQSSVNQSLQNQITNVRNDLTATQIAQSLVNVVMAANISQLNTKVNQLTSQLTGLQSQVNNMASDISTLESQMTLVQSQLSSLSSRTTQVETGLAALSGRMTSAESNITQLQSDVAYLMANQVTIVDPCPGITNSEVLLKVQGKLVAFYQGTEGFLSTLNDGSYRTTDPQQCNFTVANNQITGATAGSGGGSSGGSSNTLAGSCYVSKTANYNNEQQFAFTSSGMASYTSYTLEVTFSNGGVISQVNNNNGGSSTYVNPLYTIAPINSANSLAFYAKHPGSTVNVPTVSSAKVKRNGQELSCTVAN